MADDIKINIKADGSEVDQEFNEIEGAARRTQRTLDNFGKVRGLDDFLGKVRQSNDELGNLNGALERTSQMGLKIGATGAAGLAALGAGIKTSLDAFGAQQQVKAGFETMLGSPEAAKAKIKEVADFAKNSPFDFGESSKGAQGLLAVGVAADDLIPIMSGAGNAVAAAGGDTETFKGLLTALQQTKSEGKLTKENLNQITGRGIGVGFLAQKLGLTAEELANVGEQGIDADRAIKALTEGFAQVGGGTAMEKQMKTIPGQMSSLVDSSHQAAAAVGEVFSADASHLISQVSGLLDTFTEFTRQNPELVKTAAIIGGISFGGLAIGGGALAIGGAVARGATDLMGLVRALKGTKGAAAEAAKAKDGLVASTLKDITAEKNKTSVAGAEGSALQKVAEAADTASDAKDLLSGATEKAAGKMGLLARAKNLLGSKAIPSQHLLDEFLQPKFKGAGQLANLTKGQAAGAAGLGIVGGMEVANAGKWFGMGDNASNALGGAAGMSVSALTLMAPQVMLPAAAAIGIAEAIKFGFNHLVNEPMEKAAEAGTGADNVDVMGKDQNDRLRAAEKSVKNGGDREQLAQIYSEMSSKSALSGDEQSAQNFAATAAGQRRIAKRENQAGSPEYMDALRKRSNSVLDSQQYRDFMEKNRNAAGQDSGAITNRPPAGSAPSVRSSVQKNGNVAVEVRVTNTPSRVDKDAAEYGRRGA